MIPFVCRVCGSSDVEERLWVKVNNMEVNLSSATGDIEDCYCNNCNEHTAYAEANQVIVEFLEDKGFYGIDDVEESLFNYGLVYRDSDGMLIRTLGNHYWDDVKHELLFSVDTYSEEVINEEVEESMDALVDLTGLTPDDLRSSNPAQKLSDLHLLGALYLTESELEYNTQQLIILINKK